MGNKREGRESEWNCKIVKRRGMERGGGERERGREERDRRK